jgi:hypothetical protein
MSTETETNAKPDAAGTITDTDHELMGRLERVATALFGGHLTIMRFGSNWRVGFTTPSERHDITAMAEGRTFAEAAHKALQRIKETVWADQRKRRADVEAEFMAEIAEMQRGGMATAATPPAPPAA